MNFLERKPWVWSQTLIPVAQRWVEKQNENKAVSLIHWLSPEQNGCLFADIFNTLRPRQNGPFPDDIFKCIFLNENVWISITISFKFVAKRPINSIPALVQIMACHRPGKKRLSELMMFSLLTHICITWPQWDNMLRMDDAQVPQWTWSSLVQIMVCCLPVPSHNLNQWWLIVDWTLKNKLQWDLNQSTTHFIQENELENAICLQNAICVCPNELSTAWLFSLSNELCDVIFLLDTTNRNPPPLRLPLRVGCVMSVVCLNGLNPQ